MGTCMRECTRPHAAVLTLWARAVLRETGHGAMDTELTYTPVSQAYGPRCNSLSALPCCTAAQTRSVPNLALSSPQEVAVECLFLVKGRGI